MSSPIVIGFDDGGDVFPREAERTLRAWVGAVEAVGRERDPLFSMAMGPIRYTTPIPSADPERMPRVDECWIRNSVPVAPTSEGDTVLTFRSKREAMVVAVGTPWDLVTDAKFSAVDATAIWGSGDDDWPEISVVVYRVGKRRRWAYAARFVQFYAPEGT